MGTVYLAEQNEPIRRRVALKVVKLGMDTKQVLARFNHERRSLALMDHTNIARILDAGASSRGRPFFVMDYVDGVCITAYCDHHRLTTAQRLELFIPVCRAVQHAHAKGIIHRDIKPSNVLVAVEDGKPIPKIIDFGIARVIDAGDLGKNLPTQFGELVGTPEYASPEQADMLGGEVSAATDVYSLGILLYELLVGAVPFEGAVLRKAGFSEMLRIIREEKPPSLIDRLGALGPSAADIATRRGTDPVNLRRLLDGDLNCIVGKALEKSPRDRYTSPSALAEDIERRLKQQPVSTVPPRRATRIRGLWIAAAVLFFFLVVWLAKRTLNSMPQSGATSTIVLGDLASDTGDRSLDLAFHQSVGFELQRSTDINVLPQARVDETLKEMRLAPGARVTSEIARELCERTAAKAVVEPGLTVLGNSYLVRLRARNCGTGNVIYEQQAKVERRDALLGAMDNLVPEFAPRLQRELQRVPPPHPLQQATTSSLEALKLYSAAYAASDQRGFVEAVPLLKRAIEIDPRFASAYSYLGRMYNNLSEDTLSREAMTKAYSIRDGLSERENFLITYSYQRNVTRNLETVRQTLEAWTRRYPYDSLPFRFLSGGATSGSGKYEVGIEAARRAIALEPGSGQAYNNLAHHYLHIMRLEEAEATVREANSRGFHLQGLYTAGYYVRFLKGDLDGMSRYAAERRGKGEDQGLFAFQEACTSAWFGRLREARSLVGQAIELASQAKLTERATTFRGANALWEAYAGNVVRAQEGANRALGSYRMRDSDFAPALALIVAGDTDRGLAVAHQLSAEFPEDTTIQFKYLPAIEGMALLNQGARDKAVTATLKGAAYDLAEAGLSLEVSYGAMDAVYIRGLAHLRAGNCTAAAADFQTIVDHPGVVLSDITGALAHLQLARALAGASQTEKAKAEYRRFLEIWNDADSDIPLLQQAAAEYARL
jgi:serine/threonine protein kinase/tetratricopeptide (TPR) repeat protein